MLMVAFAIAGRVDIDLVNDPIDFDPNGNPVYLKDIWPTQEEINDTINQCLRVEDFENVYSVIFDGDEAWKKLEAPEGAEFIFDENSTYIREVPFFHDFKKTPDALQDINNARVLLYLGDSVTTDHISPAGSFNEVSAAGKYLLSKGVERKEFNSYGSRRGNHEVMMRGTFANVRIKNKITDKVGGFSLHFPTNETASVFDVAQKYQKDNPPLIVLAGKEYGSGSSRDWAAKGVSLLGVKAVIAESFERIHRSNLVQMGILPLVFSEGETADSLGLKGNEIFTITGIADNLVPFKKMKVRTESEDGSVIEFEAKARLDSEIEVEYFKSGGILQYVLGDMLAKG